MAEEAEPATIQQRIAALKLQQVGRVPDHPPPSYEQVTRTRPPLPARPAANVPPTRDHVPVTNNGMDGISRPLLPPRNATQSRQSSDGPALPPRRPSDPSPALPPPRPSEAPSANGGRRPSGYSLARRVSNGSVSSVATARSSISGMSTATSTSDRYTIRAPEFDPSKLPPLPPKRTAEEKAAAAQAARRPLNSTYSSPSVQRKNSETTPLPPAPPRGQILHPPGLPQRPTTTQSQDQTVPARLAPPPRKSALTMGLSQSNNAPPPLPSPRPDSVPNMDGVPPPVPAGRPDLAALKASKPRLHGAAGTQAAPTTASCLLCRDFSAPDNHAARFPRQSMPSGSLDWLAQQLCAPFPSHTDKARAIFTWLHHNIAYDTAAFFSGNLKASTPQSTLSSGLAVCEGYAGLFAALALKAGLEALTISGHGKGYGHSAVKPGDPIPPYTMGHAWNAVRIDDGVWKLIDACWGAGAVNGANQPYTKRFAPERFTQSNEEFGLSHFPSESSKQFRSDGRVVSWEEYILGSKSGTGADMFSGFVAEEGIAQTSFNPQSNPIVLPKQGPAVRFSFHKICPHWDPLRCGKGPWYLYVLHLEALDGTDRNHVPFESRNGVWWCDVPLRDLGGPGKQAQIYTVTSFDGRDGRGLTIQQYRQRKGRVGMGFGGVCKWDIA